MTAKILDLGVAKILNLTPQRIKTDAGEKQTLTTENQRLVAETDRQVEQVRTEVTAELSAQSTAAQLAQHRQEVIEWSELAHSIEIEQTRLRLAELQIHGEALDVELRAESEATEQDRRALRSEHETLTRANQEIIAKMTSDNERLQAVVHSKDREIETKQQELSAKDELIAAKSMENFNQRNSCSH